MTRRSKWWLEKLCADAIEIDFDPEVPAPGWTPVAVLSNLIVQCSTFDNSRLHPPAAFANDLPTRFLRHPTFQRAFYDRMLELTDTLLRTPAFDEAADVISPPSRFPCSIRALLDQYLQVELARIAFEIRAW